MQAIQGYFDGVNIKALERFSAKPNQRVIITVMDEFVESENSVSEKVDSIEDVFGILSEYANPVLIDKEKTVWERAAVQKHAYS